MEKMFDHYARFAHIYKLKDLPPFFGALSDVIGMYTGTDKIDL